MVYILGAALTGFVLLGIVTFSVIAAQLIIEILKAMNIVALSCILALGTLTAAATCGLVVGILISL